MCASLLQLARYSAFLMNMKCILPKGSKQMLDMGSPGGMTKKQTDFILSLDRKIMGNCKVITNVDMVVTTEWS